MLELPQYDEFTCELVNKLCVGQQLSTEELREALKRANVHFVLIDYISDLHAHKVEGKTSTPATKAKRTMQLLDAFSAYTDEFARAKRNGEKISQSKAIELAAKRLGVSPSTARRHLKQYRKK